MAKEFLTVEEVARKLAVKETMIRALIFRNEIPYLKIGKLIRFENEKLNQWIKKQTQGESDETVKHF